MFEYGYQRLRHLHMKENTQSTGDVMFKGPVVIVLLDGLRDSWGGG